MIALSLLTIAVVLLFPKISKAVPASLASIIVVFGLVICFDIDTKKVSDIASVSGGFPEFAIPQIPFTSETLNIIFPYALIMAGVGLIETWLTLQMVDDITQSKGNSDQEAMA
jgi:SulP family sulfate permease